MAAAFVSGQGSVLQSVGSQPNLALAFASNVAAGNLIAVAGVCNSVTDIIVAGAVTDGLSNTYTRRSNQLTNCQTAIWGAPNIAGGACTVTLDPTGSNTVSIGIAEFSGMATASEFDVQATGNGVNSSPASGNLICTQNDVIVGVVSHNGANVAITPAGSGIQIGEDEDATDMPINFEYKIVAASTTTASWTLASGRNWSVAAAAFKEGAAVTVFPRRSRTISQAVKRASSW